MTQSFEDRVEVILSQGYQLISLMQFVQTSSFRPPGKWRVVLHRPPILIFSYGWGKSIDEALSASLEDYEKLSNHYLTPAKAKELTLDDLDL